MGAIAAWISEIDFAVLDDRVVPVGNIQRTIETLFRIDRTESHVRGFNQFGLLNRFVTGSIFGDFKAADAVCSEVVGNHRAAD